MRYPSRLAPLLVGVAQRQALSRTAMVQASLSRPGSSTSSPAAPDCEALNDADPSTPFRKAA